MTIAHARRGTVTLTEENNHLVKVADVFGFEKAWYKILEVCRQHRDFISDRSKKIYLIL